MRPPSLAPLITVDPAAPGPLYRQISLRLREAVAAGTLAAGTRLPSARSLAGQLGIARGTVDTAYALLAGEGVIIPRGPAGTIVAPHLAGHSAALSHAPAPSRHLAPPIAAPARFRMGLPALDAFPRKLWSGLVVRAARGLKPADLAYPDPAGDIELREAVSAYLAIARGIACAPQQVFITGGFQGALALVARMLLQPGDSVWVEDPGYFLAQQSLRSAGLRLVPVPVDEAGLQIAVGVAKAPRARLALVTPTHQSPLGVALSLERRLQLLAWAAETGAWIIEDDYDSEFRYVGHPLPALKSLDRAERVLYVGSFSKVLFPSLRLGYLVVPEGLIADVTQASRTLQSGQPGLEQRAVALFLQEGHFARHLRRMRTLYAARRAALAEALLAAFGRHVEIALQPGGMHLLARFPDAPADTELVRRAVAQGLAPTALSSVSLQQPCGHGLLLSFTNIPETEAQDTAKRLLHALTSPAPDDCLAER